MTSGRFQSRKISGVLLLDKASGFSSNGSLQKARRLFRAEKAGHTGSLDPIASGLLPVCFGEATKFSGFLLNTDKRYSVRIRLGSETDTADIEGIVIRTSPVPPLTKSLIEGVLHEFRGEGVQVPPMYSALKHQGQRLYDLARKGIEVDRPPRSITIFELNLEGFDEGSIDLDVHCSKGTYIRTLSEDIGRSLGCGGHVEILRRTAVGRLKVQEAKTNDQLEAMDEESRQAFLMPIDCLVEELPRVDLQDQEVYRIQRGGVLTLTMPSAEGTVALFGMNGAFIGVGEMGEDQMVSPKRMVSLVDSD